MQGAYRLNSEKVTNRMQELDLSVQKLATKAELSWLTVNNAVNKELRISERTTDKIASALEISFDVFINEEYAFDLLPKEKKSDASKNGQHEDLIRVFKTNLRARQRYCGISREELAKRTNLSMREMGKLMNGQVNPRISTVYSVAKALDVSIDDLLTDGYAKTLK